MKILGDSSYVGETPNTPVTPEEPTVPDTPEEPTVPDTPEEPTVPDTPEEPDTPPVVETIVHNFTTSGKDSEIFTINGNLSTNKGTATYNGLTLTQCLKLESSTSISFTLSSDMTIVLVLGSDGKYSGQTIKIDGVKYVLMIMVL